MRRSSVIPILLTYFIDYFGFAIVFLVVGPLVLNQTSLYSATTVGFLAFPLAQSLGAPVFGILSDKIGRKTTFLISVGGTVVGNYLMGLSFYHSYLPLLLVGRLLAGFFAGNLTLCLASLADLSHTQTKKLHNFSLLAAVGGLSYISAILFGDFFAELNFATLFWITSGLGVINIILLLIFFHETHPVKHAPFGLWKIILSITKLFKNRPLNHLYLSFFFFMLAWVPSLRYLPDFLMQRLKVSDQNTFIFLTLLGALWTLSNGVLSRIKVAFSHKNLFQLLLLLTSFFVLAGAVPIPSLFISSFVVINISAALAWTYLFVGISNLADLNIQGEVLGVSQAIGSIGAVAGFGIQRLISNYFPSHYYIFAAIILFFAAFTAIPIAISKKKI